MGAKLLNTKGLLSDCALLGGTVTAVVSQFVTIDGFPAVLAGTTVDGMAVVPLSAPLITIEGKSVLTTDDLYAGHFPVLGVDTHPIGGLNSAASSVSLA